MTESPNAAAAAAEIVPTISTSATGPLGIMHLPRLWQKLLLHACGRLPADYRHGAGGFDGLVFERLGLDADAAAAYVARARPDYLTFERWVAEHARDLRPATIATLNQRLRTGNLRDEMAAERRKRFGIADDAVANAILLNDLDDWMGFHERLVPVEGRPLDGENQIG